jgi:diguanylate cyclase (GGDEF)-like protein
MSDDPFERGLDIEQAQLRGFARSIAEVEWLLLVLVMLYLFVTAPEYARQATVIGSLVTFAVLVLVFRLTPGLRERTLFKITLETLVMVAFLTAILSQSGGETNPLVNLYLLPIIAAALALGKRATVLIVLLVCVCYFTLAIVRGGVEALSPALVSQAAGVLAPFFLVAFLTTMLADNIQTAKRRIRSLSDRDELTNIYNIRAFMRLAEAEHARSVRMERPYSILMVDLDNLKSINDSVSHAAGNRALKLVADSLLRITRSEDVAARFGGDEFIVSLPSTPREVAEEVAQRIRNVVYSSTLEVDVKMVRVNVSVGAASYPADGKTLEALMQSADRAMYRDKEMRRVPKDGLVVQKP